MECLFERIQNEAGMSCAGRPPLRGVSQKLEPPEYPVRFSLEQVVETAARHVAVDGSDGGTGGDEPLELLQVDGIGAQAVHRQVLGHPVMVEEVGTGMGDVHGQPSGGTRSSLA